MLRSRRQGPCCNRRCCSRSHDGSAACSNVLCSSALCSSVACSNAACSNGRNRTWLRSHSSERLRKSGRERHRSERRSSGRRNRKWAGSSECAGNAHGSSADGSSYCRSRTSGQRHNRKRSRSHNHRRAFRTAQTPELETRDTANPLPTRQPQNDSSWGGSSILPGHRGTETETGGHVSPEPPEPRCSWHLR
jgi:hypothetical protein